MDNEAATTVNVLDENARRYYLEVMGVQCWQSLESQQLQSETPASSDAAVTENDRGGISGVSSSEALNWPQLQAAIQQCDHCCLCKTRKQAIAGRGNQSAELMFVFLSPGMNDDASGMLCSGEANELFSKMLNAINVSINDVYITSLLKCAVPTQHTVTVKELQQCNAYLKQQIQLVQPKLLIVLGETAVRCLLQKNPPLDELRSVINTEVESIDDIRQQFESVPLMVSYSPQELLQQPENKRKAWADLQHLQKII